MASDPPRAPVLSLFAYPVICFGHTLPQPQTQPWINYTNPFASNWEKESDILLRCWHPGLSLGSGVAYSRAVWMLSCLLFQGGILALNLAVCPLSLGTKEGSKHSTGTSVLISESLRKGHDATQLPSAETEAWTSRYPFNIHQGHKPCRCYPPIAWKPQRLCQLPTSPRIVLPTKIFKNRLTMFVKEVESSWTITTRFAPLPIPRALPHHLISALTCPTCLPTTSFQHHGPQPRRLLSMVPCTKDQKHLPYSQTMGTSSSSSL